MHRQAAQTRNWTASSGKPWQTNYTAIPRVLVAPAGRATTACAENGTKQGRARLVTQYQRKHAGKNWGRTPQRSRQNSNRTHDVSGMSKFGEGHQATRVAVHCHGTGYSDEAVRQKTAIAELKRGRWVRLLARRYLARAAGRVKAENRKIASALGRPDVVLWTNKSEKEETARAGQGFGQGLLRRAEKKRCYIIPKRTDNAATANRHWYQLQKPKLRRCRNQIPTPPR